MTLAAQLPGETAVLNAQVLLAHVTERSRAWLLSHPELSLSPEQEKTIETAVRKLQGSPLLRTRRKPVAYLNDWNRW